VADNFLENFGIKVETVYEEAKRLKEEKLLKRAGMINNINNNNNNNNNSYCSFLFFPPFFFICVLPVVGFPFLSFHFFFLSLSLSLCVCLFSSVVFLAHSSPSLSFFARSLSRHTLTHISMYVSLTVIGIMKTIEETQSFSSTTRTKKNSGKK